MQYIAASTTYLQQILAPLDKGIDLSKYTALIEDPSHWGKLVVKLGCLK